MELDPARGFASPLNPREQSLLSLDDPNVARLKHSIEMNGQRDPVLARPVLGDDGQLSYEVIYGTTRLFACRALSAERGEPFLLRAWVGDIPDADVRQLARAENQDRRNLSAWEVARDIKANYDTVYKGKTYDFIAEQEGISRGSVGNYLQLAQLPKELVALVLSPQEITLRSGLQLMSLVQPLPESTRRQLLTEAANDAPFATSNELLKVLKAAVRRGQPAAVIPKKSALELMDRDGDVLARVTAHRSEAGQYKLDLYRFSDDEVHALLAQIRKLKGM
jgi:ParB/RepB/Spo0J family partition protein